MISAEHAKDLEQADEKNGERSVVGDKLNKAKKRLTVETTIANLTKEADHLGMIQKKKNKMDGN